MGANPPGNPLQPLPSQDARGVPATLPVSGAKRIQPSRFLTGEAATISDTPQVLADAPGVPRLGYDGHAAIESPPQEDLRRGHGPRATGRCGRGHGPHGRVTQEVPAPEAAVGHHRHAALPAEGKGVPLGVLRVALDLVHAGRRGGQFQELL